MENKVYDIIVIGAGPCAVAQIARLKEPRPASLYTEVEHFRLHWLKKYAKDRRTPSTRDLDILVLDDHTSGEYLGSWKAQFQALQITHLRSPLFFHPDPSSVDSLLAYTCEHGREDELIEIENVVGKEHSKHKHKTAKRKPTVREPAINERSRLDYFTPSTALFADFCQHVIDKYRLPPVQQAKVESVIPLKDKNGTNVGFDVKTCTGSYRARFVISCVGHGNSPQLPLSSMNAGVSHLGQISKRGAILPPQLEKKGAKGEQLEIFILGGGLSAAQVAKALLDEGIRVKIITRSKFRVKPFDVTLEWIGKFQNERQMAFYLEDDFQERLHLIRSAREGGSCTPIYNKLLKKYLISGQLEILTDTRIVTSFYDQCTSSWHIDALNTNTSKSSYFTNIDHIYTLCGASWRADELPLFRHLQAAFPIDMTTGFPALTEDLQWNQDVGFFCVGGFAALQMGPGAFNLAGGRAAADRVALRIEQNLSSEDCNCFSEAEIWAAGVQSLVANPFDALSIDASE